MCVLTRLCVILSLSFWCHSRIDQYLICFVLSLVASFFIHSKSMRTWSFRCHSILRLFFFLWMWTSETGESHCYRWRIFLGYWMETRRSFLLPLLQWYSFAVIVLLLPLMNLSSDFTRLIRYGKQCNFRINRILDEWLVNQWFFIPLLLILKPDAEVVRSLLFVLCLLFAAFHTVHYIPLNSSDLNCFV